MNERLFRTQFNQMENIEKQVLMESLATRYDMTFLGLHTFERWCQSCTTGIFEKDGREFVFVPGDTVTLGWERFAVGLNQESREELEYLFREWEMEPQNPEEMIRESMAPVRQAAIGPMLVGRELEELCWEPVKMDDPRLTAHPDWLKEFRDLPGVTAAVLPCISRPALSGRKRAFRSVSITAQTTMRFLPCWKTGASPCPRRTSGPTCVAAGVGPCFHGEMG